MDEVPPTGEVFTKDDLLGRASGQKLVKSHRKTGRTVAYFFHPSQGHSIEVKDPKMKRPMVAHCEGEYINWLARALLNAGYEANLYNSVNADWCLRGKE